MAARGCPLLPFRAWANNLSSAYRCVSKGWGVITSTLLDFAFTAVILGLSVLTAASSLGSKRSYSRLFLAGYFVCLAVDCVVGMIRDGWSELLTPESVRWLHVANVPIAYLLGPLLYGCIVTLIFPTFPRTARRAVWHLVPFGVVLAFSVCNALYAFDTARVGAVIFKITYHAWVLHGLAYLVFAIARVRRARSLLEHASADDAVLRLHWLHRFVALNGLIWSLMLIDRIYEVAGMQESLWQATASNILSTSALFALAWFGLRLPLVTSTDAIETLPSGRAIPATSSYARSGLDAEQCTKIAAELSRLLEQESLYADSQLDLQALSRRSGWPANYISQAINQGLDQNFFEFVNGFRVSAAQRCLTDPADRRTILEIALACGFGSKSTFNAVFKRMTGRTPGELRRARIDAPHESTA